MASDHDWVLYVADQCSGAGTITVRKMFGDYALYCEGKIFGLASDNGLYIKPTQAGQALLHSLDLRPPYPGAKNYFFIEDVDDHEYLSALVKVTCQELPDPKPKKPKR
jgi:TfoX/Sxy family transcriptional regulator of competence genes